MQPDVSALIATRARDMRNIVVHVVHVVADDLAISFIAKVNQVCFL